MTQRNLTAPSSGASERVAELLALCAQDFAKGQAERARASLPRPTAAPIVTVPGCEPSDLDVAIRVGQQLLDSDSVLSLREALRLLLRALGAEAEAKQ